MNKLIVFYFLQIEVSKEMAKYIYVSYSLNKVEKYFDVALVKRISSLGVK